jgi:CubicO group peptidase (beta-lactamase class C family)
MININHGLSLAILMIAAVACSCSGPDKHDPLYASIDSIMTSVVDTARFNGNVMFARNGRVIYQKSVGLANYDTREPLNDSTVFLLASMSKQFTAMGIMILSERGKLSYQDDLRKFLPELPYEGITIRHLITHTSGIPGLFDISETPPIWERNKIIDNEDVIAMLIARKPATLFSPGEKWQYSNMGYVLLATVIERASGQSYSEFLRQNVFDPAGMTRSRTTKSRKGEHLNNYASGFVFVDSLKQFVIPDSLEFYWFVRIFDNIEGDGSINSTTGDLLKWDAALYNEKLVSAASLTEAYTPVTLNDGSTYPYGFGWRVESDSLLGRIVRHSGGWPGFVTQMRRYLDSKECLIILTNNDGYGRGTIVTEVEKRLRQKRRR